MAGRRVKISASFISLLQPCLSLTCYVCYSYSMVLGNYGKYPLNCFFYWEKSVSIRTSCVRFPESCICCLWMKHGYMTMASPLSSPIIDITIYMDVTSNPGPMGVCQILVKCVCRLCFGSLRQGQRQ